MQLEFSDSRPSAFECSHLEQIEKMPRNQITCLMTHTKALIDYIKAASDAALFCIYMPAFRHLSVRA